jgi:hypothetical protein
MDKKGKMTMRKFLTFIVFLSSVLTLSAQDVKEIQFSDKKYEYGIGKDSISLFLKVLDSDGNRSSEVTGTDLEKYLVIYEDGKIISSDRRDIQELSSGQRIPSDFTFSVLVDLSIPEEGKSQIYETVGNLVKSAPDSCVYLSFFGDEVTRSEVITRQNYADYKSKFLKSSDNKFFYGAIYSKLAEFSSTKAEFEDSARTEDDYRKNADIIDRARNNKDKNILCVFTEGNIRPEDETISFVEVTEYEANVVPKVYAFYYTGNGIDENVELTLQGVTNPRDIDGNILKDRQGAYSPSEDLRSVLRNFEEVVKDAMYDFAFTYQATDGRVYSGKVDYTAEWKGENRGSGSYSIGAAETPWPVRGESAGDSVIKYLVALLVTLLTIGLFFAVVKILIPYIKQRSFSVKYYKKYVPEENVQRRTCYFCKQEILPGQMVVTKCKHIMHVHCWQQNGYKCSEYGQNCKTGIQDHIDWNELLTRSSFRDCYQTITGILAGLLSWIVYELLGRGIFTSLAKNIVNICFFNEVQRVNLYDTCVTKVSAFLTIGFVLGFFLSFIFRYNDEYRDKKWKVYLKIIGLSLLSAFIGMLAFAIGAAILCLLLSAINTTYIPWYCSFPAYLLFSVCLALSLTIKSSIPMKSALIGGLCSAVIGFFVLYFSSISSSKYGWMSMLLDFIIYGGGLGASLVTVRMLAEKYFLVIQNGIKAGQRIPIHKWMNATGGGNKVSIGITGECEIQMNWEKSNKVAKEHAQLFIDHVKTLPVIKPLATGVIFNTRAELPVGKTTILSNGDTFKIGDTTFQYVETD